MRSYSDRHRSLLVGQDAHFAEMVSGVEVAHPERAFLLIVLVVFEALNRSLKDYEEGLRLLPFTNNILVLRIRDLCDVLR